VKVLLTGFGPFGNVVDNPTSRLARVFDATSTADREVVGLSLPTSFARAPRLIAERLAADRFDALLMLGVAASAHTVRIERFARRVAKVRMPDVDDAIAGAMEGPEVLPVTIDVDAMEDALSFLEPEVSDDAGTYVCNHTLYSTLASHDRRGLRIGFLHLPPDEQTLATIPANAFRLETLARAVQAALSVV
jgi:pyroglutamyl-peptidase